MSLILFTRKTKFCIPITSWCITLQRGWKNPNTELQRKNQQQQKNRHNNIRNTQQVHKSNRQHKAWQQFGRLHEQQLLEMFKRQKVWSQIPIQATNKKVESDCLWHQMQCDSGFGTFQKEEFWQIYPQVT